MWIYLLSKNPSSDKLPMQCPAIRFPAMMFQIAILKVLKLQVSVKIFIFRSEVSTVDIILRKLNHKKACSNLVSKNNFCLQSSPNSKSLILSNNCVKVCRVVDLMAETISCSSISWYFS